ncbi:MAG TPA: TrmH family RNA methyltransferase [Bryobacteraceae bacterium]|nr:TrmH family RNA methyltransferase [Bryobacteraceae bacterium]
MNSPGTRTNLRVVLVSTRNPLNIGAAARAMFNFGFSRLRVVNPYEVAFREARSAVSAREILQSAEEFRSVADAVADCELVVGTTSLGHRGLAHTLRRLEPGAALIRKKMQSAPVALLFGSEKFGLTNEELAHCHWLMRIATADQSHSMNLGQSVAVCLYELSRGKMPASGLPARPRKLATGAANEQITRLLLEALAASGYTNPVTAASTDAKVRRLVRRLELNARDAPVVLGMLRQILWKLTGTGA